MEFLIPHSLNSETAKELALEAWQFYRVKYRHHCRASRWLDKDTLELRFQTRGQFVLATVRFMPGDLQVSVRAPRGMLDATQAGAHVALSKAQSWLVYAQAS